MFRARQPHAPRANSSSPPFPGISVFNPSPPPPPSTKSILNLQQYSEEAEDMAIGCDPELRLSLGTCGGDGSSNKHPTNPAKLSRAESLLKNSAPQHQQIMTIFYNGRVCAFEATEIQARAIISMAKKEMDDMITEKNRKQESMPQILNPTGLSMKRSLQRFLQKRKARITDVAPYIQNPKLLLFPIESQQA
ncbi:protein TIFY 5A-like [Canna indica]|uniref:Protein TIFY n=1 Tax=Canna indica TaxID=4628 RepID=A0AAQ3JL97_9LILI|nr:protein TIFY 5A-like [Canna indica]